MAQNLMKVGQSVLLKIDGEGDYSGKICFVNAERSRLQLENVTFGPTNQKIFGVKKFYTNEISSFKIISDVQDEIQNEQSPSQSPEIAIAEEVGDEANENQLTQKFITNQHAIETVGEDLEKALNDLFDNESVGLSAQGLQGKHCKITLIVCSTRQTIYVLNMKTIGDVPSRLKEWFESEEHTKVIHGANLLVENLFHCHGIKLMKIFDTMVNYKRLKNIKLPSELAEEMNSNEEESIDGQIKLINRTSMLLKFHDLLTEQLLKYFYQACEANLNYGREKDSIAANLAFRNMEQRLNEIPQFKLNVVNE